MRPDGRTFPSLQLHVLDERSPLLGYDGARAIETDARVFVTLEARDPTLATVVHDVRYYAPEGRRFGTRYAGPVGRHTTARGLPI
jgi:inward rectifier potassium channel